ncbi:integral membrane protein [Grosmannia clavigera kw1407]|uniref:Integral membrane protein n=1 Tax=Grosmannia clavigera (strain kw1407 / UAMH 11150) TaxID=655863 RepID=F0XQE0_GROCL|nr:uncharacterized protein CMQ_7539 [Grosmannia clavigera kw1407]EFX00537.1 integral membrane protein [Grosmannia clavigera kw1407]
MDLLRVLASVLIARETDEASVNNGPAGLGIIWTMVVLAWLIVLLRLYTQARITGQYGLSDYLMLVSVIIITAFASLISVQYHYGWGRHQAYVDDADLVQFFKFNITSQSFGILGSTLGRLSFIVFMVQLFGFKKSLARGLWVLFALQCITNGVAIICIYAQCSDARALYNHSVVADCWPDYVQTYIGYGHTSFNALTDLILTVLPLKMIWNLQMKLRIKISVAVLLSMSILAFVGVIMKIVYLRALSHRGDATYNTVPMFAWIVVEGTLVDIAGSVPLLRPLFKPYLGDSSTARPHYELSPFSAPLSQSTATAGGFSFNKLREATHSNVLKSAVVHGSGSQEDILSASGVGPSHNGKITVREEFIVDYGTDNKIASPPTPSRSSTQRGPSRTSWSA